MDGGRKPLTKRKRSKTRVRPPRPGIHANRSQVVTIINKLERERTRLKSPRARPPKKLSKVQTMKEQARLLAAPSSASVVVQNPQAPMPYWPTNISVPSVVPPRPVAVPAQPLAAPPQSPVIPASPIMPSPPVQSNTPSPVAQNTSVEIDGDVKMAEEPASKKDIEKIVNKGLQMIEAASQESGPFQDIGRRIQHIEQKTFQAVSKQTKDPDVLRAVENVLARSVNHAADTLKSRATGQIPAIMGAPAQPAPQAARPPRQEVPQQPPQQAPAPQPQDDGPAPMDIDEEYTRVESILLQSQPAPPPMIEGAPPPPPPPKTFTRARVVQAVDSYHPSPGHSHADFPKYRAWYNDEGPNGRGATISALIKKLVQNGWTMVDELPEWAANNPAPQPRQAGNANPTDPPPRQAPQQAPPPQAGNAIPTEPPTFPARVSLPQPQPAQIVLPTQGAVAVIPELPKYDRRETFNSIIRTLEKDKEFSMPKLIELYNARNPVPQGLTPQQIATLDRYRGEELHRLAAHLRSSLKWKDTTIGDEVRAEHLRSLDPNAAPSYHMSMVNDWAESQRKQGIDPNYYQRSPPRQMPQPRQLAQAEQAGNAIPTEPQPMDLVAGTALPMVPAAARQDPGFDVMDEQGRMVPYAPGAGIRVVDESKDIHNISDRQPSKRSILPDGAPMPREFPAEQASLPHVQKDIEYELAQGGTVPFQPAPPGTRQIEAPPEQKGSGHPEYELDDSQIDRLMAPYVKDGFCGAIASDEIKSLIPKVNRTSRMSFVMNTDPRSKPGRHWVAVFIRWQNDRGGGPEVDYCDSFGDHPSKATISQLKQLIDARTNLKTMLKFKVNKVKFQRENSSTCGMHAVRFLQDMHKNKSFKEATDFSVMNAEHLAKSMYGGGPLPRFGFI